ncbi:uncharacterized protein YdhG (YjbR/CyaY superfamily) [Arcicella aurantiaca]|uniref:Uncharacterized protein YdhG (YjbR/CyaY superfamily) n=1 Tax=Arcicella aurantiaca TaxID=591202 RepID=A0A316EF17_9BACT|nr:DUF1801 domain-containing protein [Arcicella aurantiaca]PWK27284.1 uncharacterized protein YdhG (YjbR/CyaY superfamily) [Arcicella aurantiaca]
MNLQIKNIDDYLSNFPENIRLVLEELRQTIRDTAPEAEEVISYGIPAFKYKGMLVYFAAYKKHCSLFGGTGGLTEQMKEELKDYKTSKGTIQFTLEKPLPKELVEKIVRLRMKQNEEMQIAKNQKKITKK